MKREQSNDMKEIHREKDTERHRDKKIYRPRDKKR